MLAETLLGAVGALVVLLFVFASFLALVPMLIAAVSILTTFLIVLGLTTFTDVAFVVQFLISLVGLGVAIDYSLLVVSRWREERAHGATNDEAIVTAVKTAGHAVLASGVTVAISLIALIVVPVPLLRSMGFGGMLIPVVSVAVVLTLLPALLKMAPWVDFPRIRKEDKASAGLVGVGGRRRAVPLGRRRRRARRAGARVAPVFGIQFGQASSASLASNGQAVDTLHSCGTAASGPASSRRSRCWSRTATRRRSSTRPRRWTACAPAVAWPPGRDGAVDVEVIPDAETVDNTSVATVTAVRDAVKDLPGYDGVAGSGADVLDYDRAVYDRFPLVLALIAFVTFILLVRTFRSLLLPLKAVLLNLVSVAAVFGVATWFWQEGNGSEAIFGITETGAMTFWLPVLIFAFLFGLSMDYEVFILARMREEYDRTGSTAFAVREGSGAPAGW